ncbi:hypothetical protein K443DRAFT_31646, partial [Laccaria amethystina LaAM-08-1]
KPLIFRNVPSSVISLKFCGLSLGPVKSGFLPQKKKTVDCNRSEPLPKFDGLQLNQL